VAELAVAHRGLKGLQTVFDRERASWSAKEVGLRAAARSAEDELVRERATGGVRTALAEEAERLAREEATEARADAEEARAAAAAAGGASGGALREARDEVSKLRLRENHWVGLIGCHRAAAAVSRQLAELAGVSGSGGGGGGGSNSGLALATGCQLNDTRPMSDGGGDTESAPDAGSGADLAQRRAKMEAEAEAHVEAIKAVATMLVTDVSAGAPCTVDELARERARAESSEAAADALRARLARKTEDAAALALRAKRHELRAQEESVERRRASQRSEEGAAELARAQAEAAAAQRRAGEELQTTRAELNAARHALEDHAAAVAAGVVVTRHNPALSAAVVAATAAAVKAATASATYHGVCLPSTTGAARDSVIVDGDYNGGGGSSDRGGASLDVGSSGSIPLDDSRQLSASRPIDRGGVDDAAMVKASFASPRAIAAAVAAAADVGH